MLADGGKCFECGPSNWARARVMPSSKDPNMLRVVIIFDTTVEERPAGEDRYHALSPQDVGAHGHFMLAHHVRDNSWFLNEAWVDQWLLELYTARNQGKRRGAAWGEEDPYVLKHLASYLTWLDIVRLAVKDVAVQVINPARDTPVDVDLILDIGNSRTTGILVETPPQCSTDLNQSYVLRLRDLSQPDLEYADPFETRVEFVDATFGNDTLSRRSGPPDPGLCLALGRAHRSRGGTSGHAGRLRGRHHRHVQPQALPVGRASVAADLALQHQRQHRAHGQPRPVRPPAQSAGHAALLL